ncbi:ArnT family glycosyltransferase [Luteimonas sp. R10]|uniref:ArnT family glycosyltransferase n=1 Tax=Luteimonas sp. R10 TaxID=3108176 RepID=UPI00308E5427|nr:hypothetical protein U3649_17965 [Luteimonas sp. R10]
MALGILGTYRYASGFELPASYGTTGGLAALLITSFTIGIFLCCWYLAQRRAPLNPSWYVLGLVLGGAALHLLLIGVVKPQWGTDHLRYWEYAQKLVEQGQYGGFDRPYYARSQFIPYPIIKLFGPDATFALKLANVALLGAIQIGLYDILRRLRGHQVAQAGSLLFLAAPLPAYSAMIPSHDLWGLFFLTMSIWAFACALGAATKEKPARLLWVSIAIASGLLAYIAEVQRTVGMVLCASILAASVLTWLVVAVRQSKTGRRMAIRTLTVALICVGSYLAASALDERIKLRSDDRPVLMNMKFSANAGGMGNGKSDWFARFKRRFSNGYSTPDRTADLVKASGLSSWALEPADRGAALAAHAERLFSLTYPRDWNWLLRNPNGISGLTREALVFYCDAYGLLFGLLLLLGTLKLAIDRRSPPVILASGAILIVALALPLLLVFENKPYNIFPIWLVGSFIISCFLARRLAQSSDGNAVQLKLPNPAIGGAMLLVVAGVAIHYAIKTTYTVSDGRILAEWSFRAHQRISATDLSWQQKLLDARPEAFDVDALKTTRLDDMYMRTAPEDGDRIRRYAGHVVTRMEFPERYSRGDTLELFTTVCTSDSGRKQLEFFAYSPNAIPDENPRLLMDVAVNGRDSNDFSVPFTGKDFQRFVLQKGLSDNACHEISFRLRATADARDDLAPFVEIWMPRLIYASPDA